MLRAIAAMCACESARSYGLWGAIGADASEMALTVLDPRVSLFLPGFGPGHSDWAYLGLLAASTWACRCLEDWGEQQDSVRLEDMERRFTFHVGS